MFTNINVLILTAVPRGSQFYAHPVSADEEPRHRALGELQPEQPGPSASSTVVLFPLKTQQSKIGLRFPNGFPSSSVGWNESSKERPGGEEIGLTCRKWAGGSWGLGSLLIWAQRKEGAWAPALESAPCPESPETQVFLPMVPSSVCWPPPVTS